MEILDRPFEGKPLRELPKTRAWGEDGEGGIMYVPVTASAREYFHVLARMPHAAIWTESEWQYLVETALLRDAYERTQAVTALVALDKREAVLGTTKAARERLGIHYVAHEKKASERVQELPAAVHALESDSGIVSRMDSLFGDTQ